MKKSTLLGILCLSLVLGSAGCFQWHLDTLGIGFAIAAVLSLAWGLGAYDNGD